MTIKPLNFTFLSCNDYINWYIKLYLCSHIDVNGSVQSYQSLYINKLKNQSL